MGVQMQIASVFLGLAAANKAAGAAKMEEQAYKEQAEMASIQADQQALERDTQLRKQLASLGSSMASQGVALGTSQTITALRNDEERLAKKDINAIKLMGMSNRRKYELSASGAREKGKAIRLGAYAKTAASIYDIQTGGGVKTG
tara:strand:+ start:1863 stop:2297 length:435 start_codon:yes stop_codon:yes gene_type:complete